MPFVIAGVSNFENPIFKAAAKNLIAKGIEIVVVRDEDHAAVMDLVQKSIDDLQTGQTIRRNPDLDAIVDLAVDLDPYKK